MKKLNLLLPVVLLTVIILSSCKKGDDGAQGPPGTANVIYSNWLDVKYESIPDQSGGDPIWVGEISAPKLVDSILNKGTVKVYVNISDNPVADPLIAPLPITDFAVLGLIINPYFGKQSITLVATDDASSFTQNNVKY